MLQKLFIKIIIFTKAFLLLLFCSGCVAGNLQSADQVINDFIKGEFELAQDKRAQHCAYKVGRALRLGSEFTPDSSEPAVYIFFENDNVAVVKNYHISTKLVAFDKAEAIVNYDLVFSSIGLPRRFEKTVQNEAITYNLSKINNEWKIIDPPLPRVSYEHLVSFYLDAIKNGQAVINSGTASDAQMKNFEKIKNDYDSLKK